MIFGEGAFTLLIFAFWIWAIVDVLTSDPATVRNLPKFVWLLLVVLLSTIGALAWLLLGRPQQQRVEPSARPRFVAPEDGPRWTDDHARRQHYAAMDEELDRRLEEKQRREEDPSV